MAVSLRYITQQGPVLRALGRAAAAAARPAALRGAGGSSTPGPLVVPGPTFEVDLPPRPRDLVDAYVRHVGGNPAAYTDVLPPHLFPQWGFEPASRALAAAPYPLTKAVNGGCRFQLNSPLPSGERLLVSARLESVDDDGRRAVLQQRIVTGTASAPEALVADMFAVVPLSTPETGRRPKRPKVLVPSDAREVGFWSLRANAGWEFAVLTGDFNPIHWVAPYAKAAGFRNTILHGFSTMSRAIEGLNRALFAGTAPIVKFDCRFLRPVVLPTRVGLYVLDRADGRHVWVGDAAGGVAYMEGTFATE